MTLLQVENLRGGYGAVEVLRGVSFDVRSGETVALLGSNGAGKTTLNNVVCGVVPARGGRVVFDGAPITHAASRAIVQAGLIQVPEGRRVFPDLSVRENLVLGAYARAQARRGANIDRVHAIFPRLKERAGQAAGSLSGGEQQMLAIGRALMAEPRLLILDEPSLGLSPKLVEELFALIATLKAQGLTILLVEQNVAQSLAVADRALVLENGSLRYTGTPQGLLADGTLKAAYLGV